MDWEKIAAIIGVIVAILAFIKDWPAIKVGFIEFEEDFYLKGIFLFIWLATALFVLSSIIFRDILHINFAEDFYSTPMIKVILESSVFWAIYVIECILAYTWILKWNFFQSILLVLFFGALGAFIFGALKSSNPVNKAFITFINESSTDVCHVYISPTSSQDWGDDLLRSKRAITPRNRQSFEVISGEYDLMAKSCQNKVIYERYNINATRGFTAKLTNTATSTSTPRERPTITPRNSSTQETTGASEFIENYYRMVNFRRYSDAWLMFSEDFKSSQVYTDYKDWYDSMQTVDLIQIETVNQTSERSIVSASVRYNFNDGHVSEQDLNFEIIKNSATNEWMINEVRVIKTRPVK